MNKRVLTSGKTKRGTWFELNSVAGHLQMNYSPEGIVLILLKQVVTKTHA